MSNQPRQRLVSISASGFRSLERVKVPLGPLTVLVGPNGSGKSNVLQVLRLLVETIRFDLPEAVQRFGGYAHVERRDGRQAPVEITVEGIVTEHSSDNATDHYRLQFEQDSVGFLRRTEEFTFKRVGGKGRRIKIEGTQVSIGNEQGGGQKRIDLASEQTTGLAALPRLGADQGGEGLDDFARFLSSLFVLEPDVAAARQPSRLYNAPLADDASNLADALFRLQQHKASFRDLQDDLAVCLPGLEKIGFQRGGGAAQTVVVTLKEQGLVGTLELADASFGTVRMLTLLAAVHDPSPPPLTAIEEIDHGLHPYALDVLADRLRDASERTQLLVTTHSPTFVNRLRPEEIVICDRDPESGASRIPARSAEELRQAMDASDFRLGELWFSGALGGVPQPA